MVQEERRRQSNRAFKVMEPGLSAWMRSTMAWSGAETKASRV